MAQLPEGETPPQDGSLPLPALQRWHTQNRAFGLYLHVPFCARRCGYCDFTTYTFRELDDPEGADVVHAYLEAMRREYALAAQVLGQHQRSVSTIFVGGGTPTMLAPRQLTDLIGATREHLPWASTVEVSVEANPDTVTPAYAQALASAGVTRVSMGMQSSVTHVLRTLDRTHQPSQVATAVALLRDAGLSVSVDLIYGTPGESLEDWGRTVEDAVALEPDHVSAYALTIESDTAMGRLLRRGVLPAPDADLQADQYLLAHDAFEQAGLAWYEISNWARTPQNRCQHNLGYWRGDDWWGCGPGAHSHVAGVRWWNAKRPATYAESLALGRSPAVGREVLSAEAIALEAVMLGVRTVEGLPVHTLTPQQQTRLPEVERRGWGTYDREQGRLILSVQGRLLADSVIGFLLA